MNGINITPNGVMGVSDHNGSPHQMNLPTITNYELQIKHYYAQKHLSALTILLKS